jgi:hypothetical protein
MTAWEVVHDATLALLPSLAGWSGVAVYDQQPVTGSAPPSFVTVGFTVNETFPGSGQDDYGLGDIPAETGVHRSDLVCWTGAADLLAVRTAAFDLLEVWRDALRADPTMGVAGLTVALAYDVQPAQTTDGAVFRLIVSLNYTALLG